LDNPSRTSHHSRQETGSGARPDARDRRIIGISPRLTKGEYHDPAAFARVDWCDAVRRHELKRRTGGRCRHPAEPKVCRWSDAESQSIRDPAKAQTIASAGMPFSSKSPSPSAASWSLLLSPTSLRVPTFASARPAFLPITSPSSGRHDFRSSLNEENAS